MDIQFTLVIVSKLRKRDCKTYFNLPRPLCQYHINNYNNYFLFHHNSYFFGITLFFWMAICIIAQMAICIKKIILKKKLKLNTKENEDSITSCMNTRVSKFVAENIFNNVILNSTMNATMNPTIFNNVKNFFFAFLAEFSHFYK